MGISPSPRRPGSAPPKNVDVSGTIGQKKQKIRESEGHVSGFSNPRWVSQINMISKIEPERPEEIFLFSRIFKN